MVVDVVLMHKCKFVITILVRKAVMQVIETFFQPQRVESLLQVIHLNIDSFVLTLYDRVYHPVDDEKVAPNIYIFSCLC